MDIDRLLLSIFLLLNCWSSLNKNIMEGKETMESKRDLCSPSAENSGGRRRRLTN
jgi:hypothetical protein